MLTSTALLAAAEEPSRGWGGPIALGLVLAVYITGATLHDWWLRTHEAPSPTEEDDPGVSDPAQVSAVSDTDDTDRDTGGWWGRLITLPDGRRVRSTAPTAPVDEELDLDLDGDQDKEEPATIEDVIGTMLDRGHQYAEIVRHVMEEFEVSEATAKRRIRDVRAERIAAAS
ncbi:hypothetical protein DER29_4359 [Micromonospora sp. M71_S20]|uniref:hypothetical protein n=1 Tax=Micromonospora sp. M71_S20 TaxID=592872 RepID=UPI000EB38393|nr:hypothetical protein [Micromonospora sp. M71_S20]RLK13341.1 hypothetical protein DER29_4359 [Micromonospora sp. M71_S20]